jgi:lipopolysaccharide transport system permease protein
MVLGHLKDLYAHRYLIWVLAWGDFKWRYKNSYLGYFWSLLEPFVMFIILYVVFSNLMKLQVEYYQLFLLIGIMMWNYFARASTTSLAALIFKNNLVQKIYFPRDILVISTCVTATLMSLFESIVLIAFLLFFRIPITASIVYLPFILAFFFLLTLGVSLLLAGMNTLYHDIQYIWNLVLQAGFFITPIIYPLQIFSPMVQNILRLNPLAQIIIITRDCVLYGYTPNLLNFGYACITSTIILILGYFIFMRLEPRFAEEM